MVSKLKEADYMQRLTLELVSWWQCGRHIMSISTPNFVVTATYNCGDDFVAVELNDCTTDISRETAWVLLDPECIVARRDRCMRRCVKRPLDVGKILEYR